MENTICVVEDNLPIRKLFCTLLKKSGYEVSDFGDGKTALEWLKNNRPILLLCDILLPDMNGGEIMKFVRELPYGKEVPIVAATGFAQLSDREKFLEMGFDGYISKPINTAIFVQEIVDLMNAKKDSLK